MCFTLGGFVRYCRRSSKTGDAALEHVSRAVEITITVFGSERHGDQDVKVVGCDVVCSLSTMLFRTVFRAM
jgi:hypothetical protein